mgnify:FL=1
MADNRIRNMEEFAALSGISRPTVSKYFYDPNSVRPSTRAQIETALREYNYRPNIYAINQNRRLTKNIGIVVPYLADPFFAEMARKIERLCIGAGFRPILLSSHGDRSEEVGNLDTLRSIKPAGVLMAPLGRMSDKDAVQSFCADVPTILFDSNIDNVGAAFIGSDNDQSIGLIVDYLCRTGEPPAFFEMKTPSNPNAIKRHNAYAAAIKAHGVSPEFLQAEGQGWDFEDLGYREGMRIIEARMLPTKSILCSNDRLAIGFLAASHEKGLRVGNGPGYALRVAGHDDHPFSRFTCPKLTTVAQDYAAIAQTSMAQLLTSIESGQPLEKRLTTLFSGTLIVRESA